MGKQQGRLLGRRTPSRDSGVKGCLFVGYLKALGRVGTGG